MTVRVTFEASVGQVTVEGEVTIRGRGEYARCVAIENVRDVSGAPLADRDLDRAFDLIALAAEEAIQPEEGWDDGD